MQSSYPGPLCLFLLTFRSISRHTDDLKGGRRGSNLCDQKIWLHVNEGKSKEFPDFLVLGWSIIHLASIYKFSHVIQRPFLTGSSIKVACSMARSSASLNDMLE
jgi:hypothetical protein